MPNVNQTATAILCAAVGPAVDQEDRASVLDHQAAVSRGAQNIPDAEVSFHCQYSGTVLNSTRLVSSVH